jgi:hypothetical protein
MSKVTMEFLRQEEDNRDLQLYEALIISSEDRDRKMSDVVMKTLVDISNLILADKVSVDDNLKLYDDENKFICELNVFEFTSTTFQNKLWSHLKERD